MVGRWLAFVNAAKVNVRYSLTHDQTMTQAAALDFPTLIFASVCIASFLGIFLIINWVKQRDIAALAWWGSAYLIGAAAISLWSAPDQIIKVPAVYSEAMIFAACGMFWNGLRLFYGREMRLSFSLAGAGGWLRIFGRLLAGFALFIGIPLLVFWGIIVAVLHIVALFGSVGR